MDHDRPHFLYDWITLGQVNPVHEDKGVEKVKVGILLSASGSLLLLLNQVPPFKYAQGITMINPSDLTDEMIEELDEFLISDNAPEDGLLLSDLDGFLTGIVVGPELIMPSEWMPVIWGGGEPEFNNDEHAERIIGIIMARYNQIILHLSDEQRLFTPIVYGSPDGSVIIGDWAAGFMDALGLRVGAWRPLLNDEDAGYLMMPFLALTSEADAEIMFQGMKKQTSEIIQEISESLPDIIKQIHDYWKGQRGTTTGNTRTFGSKVGRNEPCPCGSGRKYKRCCGAN